MNELAQILEMARNYSDPEYRAWVKKNKIRDAFNPESYYDYYGAWLSGLQPSSGHWSDVYKLPGHPTYSAESMYWTPKDTPISGYWQDDEYVPFSPIARALRRRKQ